MFKGFKKASAFLLALLMLLTACAGAQAADKVKINAWYAVSGISGETFQALVDEFNASQDAIEVVTSFAGSYADAAAKISASLLSHTEPEVALMSAGPLYTGARGDFTMDALAQDADFGLDDFFPGVLEYCMFDGKICSIPYGISTPVFYYNKAIVAAAGLDFENNPPKTWAELYDVCQVIMEKGNLNNAPDFTAFDVSDDAWLFKTMLAQNGNDIVTVQDGKTVPVFDQESAVEVATFWKSLVDAGYMKASQHANAEKKFLAGNLAFIVASSVRIARWATDVSVELGAIEMPYFKEQSVALGGNMLVLFPKDEAKNAAAWEFIKFLSTTEKQTEFALKTGYMPVCKSGLEMEEVQKTIAENPLYAVAFKQMDYAWAYWNFNEMGTMDGILKIAISEIEIGAQTPDRALKNAVSELEYEIE